VLNIGNVVVQPRFSINGILLPTVLSCRDLGITVSHDLSPSAHISGITVKAHQRANLIFRSFVSLDASILLRAYLTYARPLVECNSVVWSPCLKQDIKTIEHVQCRFTKRLPGFKNLTYTERLKRLKLLSLELRHLYSNLIWCYKISFGYVDISSDEFFAASPAVHTRGHPIQTVLKT